MLNKHDELLLKDLKLQPLWLLQLYVVLGVVAAISGFVIESGNLSKAACLGGGFLIALGAEKLVTHRIRKAALSLVNRN
ncbi:hypothetical protein H6F74_05245 [Trichocoleus sp. FACHB-90]|uniref:Uncharacterized protein n=1 Tax=Funiculus sociatus GB2-A5 TaxID=2933946 RepID=A0ABV0JIE6_9CYAN|nr:MULTISPECIES: hypothetical protein [Cyanophyceae]MBD1833525.1 hypothetical protein [Cyanobacteria bacterium FACHB-472]MBD1922486.1 hypothetical protein [Microcoleus sp. FACHB-831]MBD1925691.1 hypothetical protein [Trichocoleus sp. FACHB-90]MBD1932154.1 hypothetical protein [Trichocoleus sp. FACHB-69]MBD2003266.1 hypothetical protein [Trichocoleus sp. FACHB-40]